MAVTQDNSYRYEGSWLDGSRHGYAKETTTEFVYEGNFVFDERSGQGEANWPNQDNYIGQWSKGEPHGNGIYLFKKLRKI